MAGESTNTTPEQDARILYNTLRKNDDVTQNDLVLSDATLDAMFSKGLVVARKPEELNAQSEYQISSQLKDKNIAERPPVYVVVGQDMKSQDMAQSMLWTTKEGKSIILVNEAAQKQWTPDYVKDHILDSDQIIQTMAASGKLTKTQDYIGTLADTPGHQPLKENIGKVLADTMAATGRMEVTPPPEIYIDKTGAFTEHGRAPITTATSKEGHNYVFINERALQELSGPEAVKKFEIADDHELAHILLGHNTAASLAATFHNDAKSRSQELQADLLGSSPVGTDDPDATAKVFLGMGIKNIPRYEATHPNDAAPPVLTAQYLHKVSDWMAEGDPTHPPIWDRIVAEKILKMEMGKDTSGDNLSPVDRSKHLVEAVMQQMNNPETAARQFDIVAAEIKATSDVPKVPCTPQVISK